MTVTTYQILTYPPGAKGGADEAHWSIPHLQLFTSRDWGLIIYDEVHLLPAPVFRITAEIQARRRLGLTATLVREDGRENDVFSLIGPKKFDVPWRVLEQAGMDRPGRLLRDPGCAAARAPAELRAGRRPHEKYRVAAREPAEDGSPAPAAGHAPRRQRADHRAVPRPDRGASPPRLGAPLITGKIANRERERLYDEFRRADVKRLVVSKVANFAIDLPEANVAIQVSGTFGSRQEEAQRLGRILRPKADGGKAHFYTVVTRDTNDQEFAANRQLFLTEQGYRYTIMDATTLLERAAEVGHNA